MKQSIIKFFSVKDVNTLKYYNDIMTFIDDIPYIMLYVFGYDICIIDPNGYIYTLNTYTNKKALVLHDFETYHPIVTLKP